MILEIVCDACGETLVEARIIQDGLDADVPVRPCPGCLRVVLQTIRDALQDLQRRQEALQ